MRSEGILHTETRTTYVYQLLRNGTTWVDMFDPIEDYAEILLMEIWTGPRVRLVRRTVTDEVMPS